MVLNLSSTEPQGFGESVSGVRRLGSSLLCDLYEVHVLLVLNTVVLHASDALYSLCTNIAIYICFEFEEIKVHFIFQTTKGSMNACLELMGLSVSNKVKSHCGRQSRNVVLITT